jgi:hypothetical protein
MIEPKDFIQAFRDLHLKSPQCGSWTRASENCDYGDVTTVSKDCYMCFNTGNSRDAYYCEDCRAATDCVDCAFCEECELCYECTDCNNCYDSNYCQDCTNCEDIHFSYDLRRCKHCFGCVGVRNKEFCIFNEQFSKEDYEKYVGELDFVEKRKFIEDKVEELKLQKPRMFVHQNDTQNCTGDYVYHSKNCYQCFDTRHTEDSGYIYQANLDKGTNDCWDCGPIPTNLERCYDVSYAHNMFNSDHCYWCGNLKDSQWCINCLENENLFGCNYMQNKFGDYYVLNEKVSEEDFHRLKKEINEELKRKGVYTLHDLLFKDLSKAKSDISDDVLDRECETCGAGFEIVPNEVGFLKERDLMLPVCCPNCRSKQRFALRNERKMYKRKCDACQGTLISTFPPDSEYTVYDLDCWYKHIG